MLLSTDVDHSGASHLSGPTSPPARAGGTVRRLVGAPVRPYFGRVLLGVVAMAVVAATTAINAWLMEPVLDEVFVKRDSSLLLIIPLAVIVIAAAKGIAGYLQSVIMNDVGQRIISDLQTRLFAHLMHADLAYYHETSSGQLTSRLTNDVSLLRGAVTTALAGIARDSLTLAFLIALMFYQDWRLALASFFVFPAAVWPIRRIGKRMRKVSTGAQNRAAELTAILTEAFQGIRHIKAYGMEEKETQRAAAAIERLAGLVNKAARVRSLSHPIMEVLGSLAIAIVIYYGGSQVIAGTTTPGTFFSFITALLLAYQPVKNLSNLNANLQEGLAAADRVFTVLDGEPRIGDRDKAAELTVRSGEIRFEDVSFAYGSAKNALNGVSLIVPAGKTAALVGPSGGGKSTIVNLIPRFYDPDGGRIRIDGADPAAVTLASLRRNIALVSQETGLFHDTIRANIAFGRSDASDSDIRRAAQLAGADEFIGALPDGYDSIVGERGAKLSGGQRQRLAIARALLRNAPILLLDEATSALDGESERQVQAALTELMRGRTTLIVAHRLSTVVDADVIYVIGDGRVVEQGRHAELVARGGLYARLYASQVAEERSQLVGLPPVAGAWARA